MTHLVKPGHLTLPQALALVCHKPADIIGIPGGRLREGGPADLALFDPEETWTVEEEEFHSKSKNSAFIGHTLTGRVNHTIIDGVNVTASF